MIPPSASGGRIFRGFTGSLPLRPVELLASLADPTEPLCVDSADGGFYTRASSGSVALPAAGYDYGGNWASTTGGTLTRWNGN